METNKKNLLFADMSKQAQTEAEQQTIRDFMNSITEEQAAQILDLYTFTETFNIPIWDNETGGPARDAGRNHDTPPDRYITGHTNPRNVADDLVIILFTEGSLEGVQQQIELTAQLTEINKQYWQRLGDILGEPGQKLLSVSGKRATKIDFPVDKVNSNVWKMLTAAPPGQIGFDVANPKSNKPILTFYSIDFDALGDNVTISRKLEPFDQRVYLAVSALYNAGNTIISFSQIYKTMGYTSAPNQRDTAKIGDSIAKMAAAHLSLDNSQEAKSYRYDKFVYNASLLPMERIEGVINGKAVEAAIHLFREPPLISFARGRKQITTIDKKLLETPVNKTSQNLMIENYLIERIAHAKTGRQPTKILYSTIYKEANITEKKQRQRAKEKLDIILGHYVKCGYINSFTQDRDGIQIEL